MVFLQMGEGISAKLFYKLCDTVTEGEAQDLGQGIQVKESRSVGHIWRGPQPRVCMPVSDKQLSGKARGTLSKLSNTDRMVLGWGAPSCAVRSQVADLDQCRGCGA